MFQGVSGFDSGPECPRVSPVPLVMTLVNQCKFNDGRSVQTWKGQRSGLYDPIKKCGVRPRRSESPVRPAHRKVSLPDKLIRG